MLTLGIFHDAFDFGLTGVFLFLDGLVYWLVGMLFSLYITIAGVSVSSNLYQQVASNFEVIVGVFALFYLAYALLKALVNPDELQKHTPKIVINLITSLILLGIVPMIFNYSIKLQNLIISQNVIGNLIYGTNNTTDIENAGYNLAMTTLEAFLTVDPSIPGDKVVFYDDDTGNIVDDYVTWDDLKNQIVNKKRPSLFMEITAWSEPVHDEMGTCDYMPIISTICGIFLAYVVLSFCLDMSVRVIKLAFYQIISPIPILMRILPEKKSIFDNWVKATMNTWLEVFIRIFIIQLGVFLISIVTKAIKDGEILVSSTTENVSNFIIILIIFGFMTFIKEAPKLISETLGLKGNIKIGIGGKLAASGAYGAAVLAGGTALAGVRGLTHGLSKSSGAWDNFKNNKSVDSFMGAVYSTIGNGVTGAFSGTASAVSTGVRGAQGAFKAKNLKEARTAVAEAMQDAEKARERRENYRASHGGTFGAMSGHISDLGSSAARLIGVGSGIDALKRESGLIDAISSSRKAMADAAKAEITKEGNIVKYKLKDKIDGFDNLSTIDNLIETIKSSGTDDNNNTDPVKVAERLTELRGIRQKIEDKMVESYLNGINLDSTKGTLGAQDASNIAGPVREAISKYHTNLTNNIGAVMRNITAADLDNPVVQDWKESVEKYLRATKGMDIKDIIGNSAINLGEVAEMAKKFAGTAGSNVNTRINTVIEREQSNNR